MRAGSARLPRAAGTGERKSGPEWPGLCWKGCRRQRQLFERPEGGTMGDDMDAIVPEREMKVEIGWGLTACGSPRIALERPPLPACFQQFARFRALASQRPQFCACR